MTTTEALIAQYGLVAVFVGGLLEGETVLILAAVAAQHGILSLAWVFVVAAAGATIGDQMWFLLSRYKSDLRLLQKLVERREAQKAFGLIQRHPTLFILAFRFVYGLRIAGAVACGLSKVAVARFMVLNFVAALVWTAVVLALGYAFGSAIEAVLGKVRQVEWKILIAAASIAVIFLVGRGIHQQRRRQARKRGAE